MRKFRVDKRYCNVIDGYAFEKFLEKNQIIYLQLWPWRQFVYAAFASHDVARRARTPAVEGKGRDHAGSAEQRRRRKPLLRLMYFLTRSNKMTIRKFDNKIIINKNI